MRSLVKVVAWLCVGVGVVALAIPLTGFQAASPWRYTLKATGNVTSEKSPELVPVSVGDEMTIGTANAAGEYETMKINETLDFGVVSFIFIVYVLYFIKNYAFIYHSIPS